ncbi:MAG: HDOD domain-containing protein [Hahellaceae bacterium]|nr:HDOD domain-containing protein [Hahellaceae bacterium]
MKIKDYIKKAEGIYALPDTTIRLQEILNDDTSSLTDVANVVSIDPTLTSKLLKLANSAFYSFPSKIDTVSRAIGILGADAVFNLALANSAVDAFAKVNRDAIDLDKFWRHSVDCALITKELGSFSKCRNIERLFVMGLLANLGELICANETPEIAKRCAQYTAQTPPWAMQKEVLGFTYAELGSELLRTWCLPPEIYNVVGMQHNPEKSSFPTEARLLHIASRVALSLGDAELFSIDEVMNSPDFSATKLSSDDISSAVEFANIEAINVLQILNPMAASIY